MDLLFFSRCLIYIIKKEEAPTSPNLQSIIQLANSFSFIILSNFKLCKTYKDYFPLNNLSKYTDFICLLAIAFFTGGSFKIADKTAAIALWLKRALLSKISS